MKPAILFWNYYFVKAKNNAVKFVGIFLGVLPMMKRQGVPRRSLTDAPESKIYRRLGWAPTAKKASLAEEFAEGRSFAAKTASQEAMMILDRLGDDYEKRHDLVDLSFEK